jgi:hypothetical protein
MKLFKDCSDPEDGDSKPFRSVGVYLLPIRRHIPAEFKLHEVHHKNLKYRSVWSLYRSVTSRYWKHSTFVPSHLRDSLKETVVS